MKSYFAELFKKYGHSIEQFGDSYIADNGTFCVPFTEYDTDKYPLAAAVSFSQPGRSKECAGKI